MFTGHYNFTEYDKTDAKHKAMPFVIIEDGTKKFDPKAYTLIQLKPGEKLEDLDESAVQSFSNISKDNSIPNSSDDSFPFDLSKEEIDEFAIKSQFLPREHPQNLQVLASPKRQIRKRKSKKVPKSDRILRSRSRIETEMEKYKDFLQPYNPYNSKSSGDLENSDTDGS